MSALSTKTTVRFGDRVREVVLDRRGAQVVARVDGREYRLSVHEPQRGVYSLLPFEDGGLSVEAHVAPSRESAGAYSIRVRSRIFEASLEQPGQAGRDRSGRAGEHGRRVLKSVMPGRIVRVLVQPGQEVKRGQGIIVIEAMKMENEIASPKEGIVREVLGAAGDRVEAGAPLAVIE